MTGPTASVPPGRRASGGRPARVRAAALVALFAAAALALGFAGVASAAVSAGPATMAAAAAAAAPAAAASPTADPTPAAAPSALPSADLRSSGQGAGAAGNPGGAVWAFLVVVLIGLATAAGTLAYVRYTDARQRRSRAE